MTAAILAIAGILAVVVLIALGAARDSRRREDAWAGWEGLFPDEDGLPPRDERLEGLLRDALNDYGQSREDHPPDMFAYVAARLVAAGVRAPTEAEDGLRAALLRYVAVDGSYGMFDAVALHEAREEVAKFISAADILREQDRIVAALAAQPAPTLDREREP